ncbi:B12-binding domain-containing radical SAM protein [Akkermansia glycaniphila]|uniref:Elongator protein 3/miab/nifb n=1 Tax=Akkermansia glycaniphila TaxID=1679444 RepID=A0A1C7PAI2_9BACT|nr:radical SAM protein [Akkermansia glycaniphila]OCA02570.1 radical SAM protein [Akkermansia glycaniphila]SEH97948.1 elongator protein 3/miab/nifb [Akkermansia glycaniphila]
MHTRRPLRAKLILPSLVEANGPDWRPIKYSLFPPVGLATLAAYFSEDDELEIIDEHVQPLHMDDSPDLVLIQVYITNAYRAYAIADHYRAQGCHVAMGGLHVTSLPDEAQQHADTIILGPGEEPFPRFLQDFRQGRALPRYAAARHTLEGRPLPRRDLIHRNKYLVPNSLVVSRGCPHHCDFCYKDAFYQGGKSFYTLTTDQALEEIETLPGKHLYFLDDHLLGHPRFARSLFEGMKGMNRLFQSAATVESILKDDLIEKAAEAGLRSLFVGFETLDNGNLISSNKTHNLHRDYTAAIRRLHSLGVMINGSFVFGLDGDDETVFDRTVDWAVSQGITTATFHIATPYPGTRFHQSIVSQNRLLTRNWDLYDTRHAVYRIRGMSSETLERGYRRAYRKFYSWSNIVKSARNPFLAPNRLRQFLYTAGWKKCEPFWNIVIQSGILEKSRPLLEGLLNTMQNSGQKKEL